MFYLNIQDASVIFQMTNELSVKPKCEFGKCTNDALLLAYRRLLCGECYLKIRNAEIKKENSLITDLENDTS